MRKRELLALLLQVYNLDGPRGNHGEVVPPSRYAMYLPAQIDQLWDFDRRHLMHIIAKALTDT